MKENEDNYYSSPQTYKFCSMLLKWFSTRVPPVRKATPENTKKARTM